MLTLAFLYFLCVLTFNNGSARPSSSDPSTNKDNEPNTASGTLFKLPTVLSLNMSFTLKGILNKDEEALEIVLLEDQREVKCKLKFDFQSKTIEITPAAEDYEQQPFTNQILNNEKSTFSLRVFPRRMGNKAALQMHFQINESSPNDLPCKCDHYDNLRYIEIKKGVQQINSLLFEFNNNH